MPKSDEDEDAWNLVLAETTDIEARVRLIAFRMSVVVREKERLEKRLARLEIAYNAGRTIFWLAPVLVVVAGFFWTNWEWISRPWIHHPDK